MRGGSAILLLCGGRKHSLSKKPRLRIALVAPLVSPIAPPFLGGAQVTVADLAYGLAERGHAVTVYAATGSQLSAPNLRLIEIDPGDAALNTANFGSQEKGINGAPATTAFFNQANLFLDTFLDIAQHQADFDIVHCHAFDWPSYAFAALCPVLTVHSVHLPAVDSYINNLLATAARKKGSSNCVTVSHACAATYTPWFTFDRVVYSGIKIEEIAFGPTAEDFVVFVGRMSPEKGADLAIEIARGAGKKLILAGGIYDQDFFDTKIAPQLASDPNLEYRGRLDRSELFKLINRAEAAIFPPRWDEAFGLALVEAQAGGTPVVTFRRGAAPEIVVDGETGFLVEPDNVAAAIDALSKIGQIERAKCRQRIEQNFSINNMLDNYEAYYYSKLEI